MDRPEAQAVRPTQPGRRRELRDFVASIAVLALVALLAFVVAQQSEPQPRCGVIGRLTNQTATGAIGPDTAAVTSMTGDASSGANDDSAEPSDPLASQRCR